MIFYKTDSHELPAKFIAGTIKRCLSEGKTVLWLVPGGSAIIVAVEVFKRLAEVNLSNLTVSLTDERFGYIWHPDSNAYQLHDAGIPMDDVTFVPILRGKNIQQTTLDFSNTLNKMLQSNDYSFGLFGIGTDGHTAGIKQGSIAVLSNRLAENFEGDDFTRITMTPLAIAMLDEAIVYAMGPEKHRQLNSLGNDINLTHQPAQALKKVNKLSIFNDLKGEIYENSN